MENRTAAAKRITIVGFFVNLLLTIAKLIAGISGKSAAMVADAVHSLSDFATDIERAFREKYGMQTHISIHTEPV